MSFRGKSVGTALSLALGVLLTCIAAGSAISQDNVVGALVWGALALAFLYYLVRPRPSEGMTSRGSVLFGLAFTFVVGVAALIAGVTDDRPQRVLALLAAGIALPLSVWFAVLIKRGWNGPLAPEGTDLPD